MTFRRFRKFVIVIFDAIEYIIPGILLLTLFISLVLQVILRYVFDNPSPELFEVSQYSFVWLVFLGAALARRHDSHMKFNVLYDKLPRKAQLVCDIIFDGVLTTMMVAVFVSSIDTVFFLKFMKSTVLRISWAYLFSCYPLFIFLLIIHNLQWLFRNFRECLTGKKTTREVKPWD
jgi:TRAP-type C4-dicarboxylate transport system permease small subunit